jgi:hypothetical protein
MMIAFVVEIYRGELVDPRDSRVGKLFRGEEILDLGVGVVGVAAEFFLQGGQFPEEFVAGGVGIAFSLNVVGKNGVEGIVAAEISIIDLEGFFFRGFELSIGAQVADDEVCVAIAVDIERQEAGPPAIGSVETIGRGLVDEAALLVLEDGDGHEWSGDDEVRP